ncbi:hypothetical protein [Streptomyces sp. NPDC058486]|uniref:hypothetical protein n=1 Tax=unclassified Streptomyces TaxID=2593676 RepID=UPI0036677F32
MPVHRETHPVTARFAEIRKAVAARYGPDSQAVNFLLYEELISMRTLLSRDRTSAPVRTRIGQLVPDIQHRFLAGGALAPARRLHRTVSMNPTIIEFDRRYFDAHYRRPLSSMDRRALLLRDRGQALKVLTSGASYLYAVDELGALWVWPQAFRLAEVMFGWAPGRPIEETRVVHPMLVPDRLRVRAAGELVVVGSESGAFVTANLKSGHFRPPAQCAAETRRAAMRVLELHDPADVDVFTMPRPATAAPTDGL